MGSTPRFVLRWPDLTDAPNGPAQLQTLAGDTEAWLCRAFPCTSSTRPTGVADGFMVRESDTGNTMVWTGSAWAQVSAATGGGGGGTPAIGTVSATYAATSAQSIPSGSDVVVAFGVAQVAASEVTRSTSGAGHAFTLAQTRLWIITATLRFAQNGTGGRTFELRAGSAVLAKAGADAPVNTPYTASLSVARQLAAGTVITAVARHNASSSLALDPSSGDYVHIDIAGI